jgi:D-sedoheptulose 7-phosphate isomerase
LPGCVRTGGYLKLGRAIKKAHRVYLCGNGGSAANAIHIANDLVSCGISAIPLAGDIATLTAIANDHDYESVFSRQIAVHGLPDDLLVCLSGSGRSPNILKAIQAAKDKGVRTFAIVGEWNVDCPAAVLADECVRWGKDMQDAEEKQLYLGHKCMKWLKAS